MNKLEYRFDCLDGRYFFTAMNDNGIIRYTIESTIGELESKEGELDVSSSKAFIEDIANAKIEGWDETYGPSSIEDAVKWEVALFKEENAFVSKGEETYEPFGYECLIKALKLCEEKADYFTAEAKDE